MSFRGSVIVALQTIWSSGVGASVEASGKHRPVGILTEAHAMRRYAEESEQRRREAVGDI